MSEDKAIEFERKDYVYILSKSGKEYISKIATDSVDDNNIIVMYEPIEIMPDWEDSIYDEEEGKHMPHIYYISPAYAMKTDTVVLSCDNIEIIGEMSDDYFNLYCEHTNRFEVAIDTKPVSNVVSLVSNNDDK